jgi:hypothetical protein
MPSEVLAMNPPLRLVPPLLALTLLLLGSSCTDKDGFKKNSGDLGTFIIWNAAKFGANVQQTNNLPRLTADWRYKEDADGIQVYLDGDHFAQLHSFLTSAFGPPAHPPMTNESSGSNKSIGSYYGPGLGAALNYACETTRDGKQYTSMVLVRRK